MLEKDLLVADKNSPFYDKKVVITGEFSILRKELADILKERMGADINTSISKNTDFVLVGEDSGPAKMEKLEKLNIQTIEVDELMPLLEPYLRK